MAHNKIHTVEETLAIVTLWNRLQDGIYSGLYVNDKGHFAHFSLTPDELATIDSRLPAAFDHYMRVRETIDSDKVHCILRYWRKQPFIIEGVKRQISVCTLTDIELLNKQGTEYVRLTGTEYFVDKTETGIEYVWCTNPMRGHAPRQTFDAQFPGWKERYDIGRSISLSAEELVAYIVDFDNTQYPLSLGDIEVVDAVAPSRND